MKWFFDHGPGRKIYREPLWFNEIEERRYLRMSGDILHYILFPDGFSEIIVEGMERWIKKIEVQDGHTAVQEEKFIVNHYILFPDKKIEVQDDHT